MGALLPRSPVFCHTDRDLHHERVNIVGVKYKHCSISLENIFNGIENLDPKKITQDTDVTVNSI